MLNISQPTRQSKLSILFYLFKGIKGLIAFVFFAAFSMRSWNSAMGIAAASFFVVMVTLVGPIVQYWFFKFHVKNNELLIEKGWLFKKRKAIPLERIQSINITQNLVQRLLGLVAVEIDTAGSKAKELEIPALDRHFAEQLKALLSKKKSHITTESLLDNVHVEQDHDIADHKSSKVILQLNFIDLLKVGITQNHLRSGGLAIGVVVGFWYKIKDVVENLFGDIFESVDVDIEQAVQQPEAFGSSFLVVILGATVVFIVASIMVSLLMSINKFYDFKMELRDEHLEVRMGLLNKKEIKIPLSKIQILEFHSNPLRKILDFKTARIYQAQSQNNQISSVEVPACHAHIQAQLQYLIFEESIEQPEKELLAQPWSHARLDMYIASTFALPLVAISIYFEFYWLTIVPILFLILIGFFGYQYGKHSKLTRDDDFIVFYKGWLFNSIIISPVYKTQAIEKWRSIFIKRRGEAHLKVHTAGGSRQIKYLKEYGINAMQNDINNQVIQSTKNWM
ncbi:PH domain-containing protein [Nonlabens mediterrranea]|uniref:PH domain-containing protein n=1 Tax=Nonlabens mediterrranea TaxID=1419947 RepID=A0ABS0A4V5_9FLAO|nr:PH domain-containing protein [Nonlabens mediterrranea]